MTYQEPEFAPWDGRRVPMTFVAGYLGAGKTTLINQVLARADRPIAVFVNDVGEVNLDARLIRGRHGDTIELTGGCVCCSLSGGFGAAFDQLRSRPEPPDHLLVELSGVADPARVLPWARTAGFVLDGVVTVVDAERFADQIDDPIVGPHVAAQVRAADLVVVAKADLVAEAQLATVRATVRATAPVMEAVPVIEIGAGWSLPGAAGLLELGGRRPGGVEDLPPATLFDQHVIDTVVVPVPVARERLEEILDGLGADVVRAKGLVRTDDGVARLVQVVGRRRVISELPEAERSEPTALVVIRVLA